ncbi:MAG: methyltransferase family protein, partial [Actinomycetota bacterium]
RWVGAVAAAFTLAMSGVAAARGIAKPKGSASGPAQRMGALAGYLIVATMYGVGCVLLWRPIPMHPTTVARAVMLGAGTLVGAAGLALYGSGRRALGDMYNVSSVLGSELYASHRLVTAGPYRIVRHPMYVGIAVSLIGALLVYRTWTVVFALVAIPGAVVRARREDALLATEFGAEFGRYRARVPGWIPRFRRNTTHNEDSEERVA